MLKIARKYLKMLKITQKNSNNGQIFIKMLKIAQKIIKIARKTQIYSIFQSSKMLKKLENAQQSSKLLEKLKIAQKTQNGSKKLKIDKICSTVLISKMLNLPQGVSSYRLRGYP